MATLDTRRKVASFEDYIRVKMRECWNVPPGARDLETLRAVIEFSLTPDGQLLGRPRIQNQSSLFQPGNEFQRIFAESALRAILMCEPYDKLPKEDYEIWKSWKLNFTPDDMLG